MAKNRIHWTKSTATAKSLRDRYATGNDAQRQTLSQQILQLEAQCEKAEAALHAEAKTIRNLEIQFRKK